MRRDWGVTNNRYPLVDHAHPPIAPPFLVGLHPETSMVIQALRSIGQEYWCEAHRQTLQLQLTEHARRIVAAEDSLAPIWMQRLLRGLV